MDYEEVYKRAYKLGYMEGVADAKKNEALLVKNLRTFLEAAKEVIDRGELPYDAFGGYSKESESQGERITQITHELSGWDAESATTPDKAVDFNDMISAGGRIRNLPLVSSKEQQKETPNIEAFDLLITDM